MSVTADMGTELPSGELFPVLVSARNQGFFTHEMSHIWPMSQLPLFDAKDEKPDGLLYWPGFVTAEEEQELAARFASLALAPFQFGAFEGKRRVASFGWRYDYSEQRMMRAAEIPDWIRPLIARVEQTASLRAGDVQQLLFTEYVAGAGIGWHRDKKAFGTVCGLSLASACSFRFRRKSGAKWQRYTVRCDRRSLYAMSGDARSVWEHSIAPVDQLRYSITFRTMTGESPGV